MPNFDQNASQSGRSDLNMDAFGLNIDNFDSFESGQFLNQNFHSSYTNGTQHFGSIRPSDLDANVFSNMGIFGASHPAELPLQIDPNLTESKVGSGQQTLDQSLTPPDTLSPERSDAARSPQASFVGAAAPRRSNIHKRKSIDNDDGDADAERRFKNRVAASKCRVKKKGREQMLIQECEQKEQENRDLRAEFKRLTQDALWLKNQLIAHGNCGDSRINQWLTNSAAKIVHKFGEVPALQPEAPAQPASQSSADFEFDRRDSGISTNSKPDFKVEPESSPLTGRPSTVKIGLGSPVEDARTQHISPVQLTPEPDVDLKGVRSTRKTKSLDQSALDALTIAPVTRAQSVPIQQNDVLQHADGVYGDEIFRDPSFKEVVSVAPPSASVTTGPTGVVDKTAAVPWDAQLSATAMTIDPRLRDGDMALNSLNADSELFASPIQQIEQEQDELQKIPEAKWMEA